MVVSRLPKAHPTKRPFHVMVKPIGPVCNLECEYCYYLAKESLYPDGEPFRMADDVLEAYVKQFIESQPGPTVDFAWQGGEPTLMGIDFFARAVELQQKYLPRGWECANSIQTNGTLLTQEWCRFFKEHDFLVGISIDGPAHLHDRYRVDKGGRPTHAKVMRGYRLLQEHGVRFNVLCVVNRTNAKHPLEVYRFFKEQGAQFIQFIPIVEHLGAGEVSDRSVLPEDYGAFLIAIYEEWIRRDVGKIYVQIFEEAFSSWLGLGANLCVFQETCGLGLAMEHNGDLFACDHFVLPEYKLGNITETPLERLVHAPKQVKFGRDKRDKLPRVCRECDVRFLCNGGCPKNRFDVAPNGQPGLNYLCRGYKAFFRHIGPTMARMKQLWQAQRPPAEIMDLLAEEDLRRWEETGRNEPCPCGSGKKYKKCCYDKRHRRQTPQGTKETDE